MTTIKIVGALTAADTTKRTITGLVLPFGSEGRTSAGTVTASKDSVTVAPEVLLNMEHDGTRPLGKMLSHDITDEGIVATFSVANTTSGNDLLAEVAEGLRTGLSVEVQEPVIRNGSLIGGLLDAVAAVTKPAFDLARVSAMTAADSGEIADEDQVEDDETTDEAETAEVEAENDEDQDDTEDATASEDIEQEDQTVTKTATASLAASAASGKDTKTIMSVGEFTERLVAARNSGDRALLAALADITQTGVGGDIEQAQFLGELWSGKSYTRVIVPLLQPGTLTSYEVTGWRWTTKPEVAAYSGDKAAVTSNTVATEPASADVVRLAGAHDIDRKFADFGNTEFLTSYMAAMTESYARKTDIAALDAAVTGATPVTPGTVPSGVSEAAAAIVDGALAVIDKGVPTFAVVAPDMWRQLLLTPKDQTLEYLSMALGLEEGSVANFKVVPRSDLDPGQVLVGIKGALQFFELPGVPIRVDAINIANGGLDQGLFGYYATMLHDEGGLALVETAPGS